MRYQLSQQQIDQYQRDGFLAIDDFLTSEELSDWRTATEEAVALRLAGQTLNNQGGANDYYANVFTQCLRLADIHPLMHQLIHDERVGEVAGRLAGVDGVRIWHDQALIKPPYGNPTAWHLDNPYWSFDSADAISIWVALDDATQANGCMWYLPGTQKAARFETVGIGMNMRDLFKMYPEWSKIEAVPAACKAGTAVFHNGLTAHGAGANMTPRPRRAMTCGFMPDGSTFNGRRNILPEELFNSYKVGDVMDSDWNALTWRR